MICVAPAAELRGQGHIGGTFSVLKFQQADMFSEILHPRGSAAGATQIISSETLIFTYTQYSKN